MFTAEQISAVHSKVKSGADFPAYIKEIKRLGVLRYRTYVADGHIDYYGANDHIASVPPKYNQLPVADVPNIEQFKAELLAHQRGKSDFLTFIKSCASYGVERWEISMNEMTCTYYDKQGNEMLVEQIPEV